MDLKPDQTRQATASFRGYAYQCYQTIMAWLKCTPNEEIRCEFAEDIDIIRRDLNGKIAEAELNQVKHEKINITLKSPAATKLINNFFQHKGRNPTLTIKTRLCTISERGRETNVDWPHADCGIDLWDRLKGRELNGQDETDSITKLRSFLRTNHNLSNEVRAFVQTSDDSAFLSEFIDLVSWDTGQHPYGEIDQEIRDLLANRPRPITDPLEIQQTIDRLWRHIVDLISTDSDRTLRPAELEEILAHQTTAKLDRATLKQLATASREIDQRTLRIEEGVTKILTSHAQQNTQEDQTIQIQPKQLLIYSGLPPLPNVCSQRRAVIEELQSHATNGKTIWIYGSTGFGKTTVANLLLRQLNTPFVWFRLRDIVDFEQIAALNEIIGHANQSLPSQTVIVLDDFFPSPTNISAFDLLQTLVGLAQRKNSWVLVTSQESAPSRLVSVLSNQLVKFDLPEMSFEDIYLLLRATGLTDEGLCRTWATLIQARTQGHPQLVGAFVTYSKEISWNLTQDVFATTPQSAEQIQKESRRQLTETIHFEEARELAKRLSIVKIQFPRDFALAVGRSNPPLQEPGRAFDSLLGPWIEQVDSKTFYLSPLLEGYAESELGKEGLSNLKRIVGYAWFLQRKLTPSQFFQLLICALTVKEEFLIGIVATNILSMKREPFKALSKNIWLFSQLALGNDSTLADLKPLTRILLRQAQLRVARHNDERDSYEKLDSLILGELETGEGDSLLKNLLVMFYMESCLFQDSPLAVRERIRRAIKAVEMVKGGLVDPSFFEPITSNVPIESLVMLATSTLTSIDDLEYLFANLEGRPNHIVQAIFSEFNEYQNILLLLMDRVWLAESTKQNPEWNRCVALYSRIIDFAEGHNLSLLLDAAARAKMIIYDEYLNDSQTALQIADRARGNLTAEPHPIIDLAESTVAYRMGQPNRSLELIDTLENCLQPNQLTLHRLFALRPAIGVAGENQDWGKVMRYIARGFELEESLPDDSLKQVVRIGLHAELGWVNHEKRNVVPAVKEFEKVLQYLESFPDQAYPPFHILRLRFGHMLGWVARFLMPRQESNEGETPKYKRPFCGMFANVEDPPEVGISQEGTPYVDAWAMLANYAAWDLPRVQLRSLAERGLASTSEGQSQIAVFVSWDAIFANDLSLPDLNAAFKSGLEYVGCGMLGQQLRENSENQGPKNRYGDFRNWANQLSSESLNKLANSVPGGVFEPILMTLFYTVPAPEIDLATWHQTFTNLLSENENLAKTLDWIGVGLKAASGDEEATRKAREVASNPAAGSVEERRLAQLISCGSNILPVSETLSAQISVWLGIPESLYFSTFETAFTRMVAKRWVHLAQKQRFLLHSPGIYAPRILEAASSNVPARQKTATLFLLVSDSTQTRLPDQIREKLKTTSTQTRLLH